MDRRVYRTLETEMNLSTRSIGRLFKFFLSKAPEIAIRSKGKVHLLIDGSYLPNGLCLILYYDHDIRYVQLYRTGSQESSEKFIRPSIIKKARSKYLQCHL
jgi:hypothetical protein